MKFSTKNFISSEDRLKCRKWPTYRLVDCRIRRAYVVSKFSTLKVATTSKRRSKVHNTIDADRSEQWRIKSEN